MIIRLVAGILFPILLLNAQPVEYSTTATFGNGQSRYIIGDETNGIIVEFVNPGTQTLSPTISGFVTGRFTQVRVSVVGNPFRANLQFPQQNFDIVISGASGSGTLTGSMTMGFSDGRPVLRMNLRDYNFFTQQPVAIGGVAFSYLDGFLTLWDAFLPAPPATLIDVRARATRATLSFSVPSIQMTVTGGQEEFRTFTVNAPSGVQVSGGFGDFVSTTFVGNFVASGNAQMRAFHNFTLPATSSTLVRFTADGLAPAYLPVQLTLLPSPRSISFSPAELSFVYTQGSAPPAPQVATVQGALSPALLLGSWDSGWMTATQNANAITVTSSLTSKPVGSHRTHALVSDTGPLMGELYINFLVNNGPGAVNITRQPATGGSVSTTPASGFVNGAKVTLTATPLPGFVFGRWSGTVNETANPTTFVLNGPANITAEFLPVTGSCTYTLNPPRILAMGGGDVGRVDIQTQSGCPWSVSQLPPWMTLNSPGFGNGPGYFSYTLSFVPNVQAFIRVADSYLMVEKTNCTYMWASMASSIAAPGGELPIRVSPSCYYTMRGSQPWLSPPDAGGYYMSGRQFRISVQQNDSALPRTASIIVGGFRVPLIQRAPTPVAPFDDVTEGSLFADHITILKLNNAVDSCSAGRYCPDELLLRSQMAELLVRARLGRDDFPFSSTPWFQDVPATHPKFKWIQKLVELGITNGCAANRYCPDDAVTRGQMAAFLVRARAAINATRVLDSVGSEPSFVDVVAGSAFTNYIYKIRQWGVTNGCYDNAYCPDDFTTRGQMAAFLVRAFFTPY